MGPPQASSIQTQHLNMQCLQLTNPEDREWDRPGLSHAGPVSCGWGRDQACVHLVRTVQVDCLPVDADQWALWLHGAAAKSPDCHIRAISGTSVWSPLNPKHQVKQTHCKSDFYTLCQLESSTKEYKTRSLTTYFRRKLSSYSI